MLPFKSLNAASSLGPGTAFDLGSDVASMFTMQVSAAVVPDGSGSSWSVSTILEGSLDGLTWFTLTIVGNFSNLGLQGGPAQTSSMWLATAPSAYSSGQSNPLIRFLRLNVTSESHLSSYAVDGWIAAPG